MFLKRYSFLLTSCLLNISSGYASDIINDGQDSSCVINTNKPLDLTPIEKITSVHEQSKLALELYRKGDKIKAQELLRMAANQGGINSQFMLGVIAAESINLDEAKKWYEMAANQGHLISQYILGSIALKAENLDEAKKWYKMAATQGYKPAQIALETIVSIMDRLAEANK